jgi:DNA-binding transcriptional LysR family regulator
VSSALASVDVDRLGKLLRLALVADQAGEITGAIHALKRALASAGLDPHYIVDAFERGTSQVAPSISPTDAQGDDRSAIWFAWHRRDGLSPRDRQFIEKLTEWRGPLSTNRGSG